MKNDAQRDVVQRASSLELIADGVADPHNIEALREAAATFGAGVQFVTRSSSVTTLREDYDLMLVVEQDARATNLFDYRLPAEAKRIALIVGGERRGVRPPLRRAADAMVAIPTRAHGVRSLNVAAAASVALSQLCLARRGRTRATKRPALLLVGPTDPARFGSSLRTAWTLGWQRVAVVDRSAVWFTADRARFALGRGAARRHRNPVRVVPAPDAAPTRRVTVVTTERATASLWQAGGAIDTDIVAIPDERDAANLRLIDAWERRGGDIRRVSPDLPAGTDYRIVTAVVLAEIARRIGWRGELARPGG